jgi:hypothetical protein
VAASALADLGADVEHTMRAMPYLTSFPAALDGSPFPTTIRFHSPRRPQAALPDWWDGSQAPLIYLTFGTVLGFMTIAVDVYRTALEALADVDARVLLTIGRRFDQAALGAAPDHVHVEAWVEQDRVLEEAALVVCHGGSGTVYGALAAGVPVVTVPLFADQFDNGRRIAAAGAGLTVNARHDCRVAIGVDDAPRIAATVAEALMTPALARRASEIGAQMAQTTAADVAVAELLHGGYPAQSRRSAVITTNSKASRERIGYRSWGVIDSWRSTNVSGFAGRVGWRGTRSSARRRRGRRVRRCCARRRGAGRRGALLGGG